VQNPRVKWRGCSLRQVRDNEWLRLFFALSASPRAKRIWSKIVAIFGLADLGIMRYLFLDRILHLERNKQIAAIKNVTLSEDVYADHFFGSPITPGALLIECLAQAGTTLLEVSLHYRSKGF
jgi:FabA-like domain